MRELPILFSGAMVRAILGGRKTQTRRIVKLPHSNPLGQWEPMTFGGPNGGLTSSGETVPLQGGIWHTRTGECLTSPHGHPGDHLWVREGWRVGKPHDKTAPRNILPPLLDRGQGVTVLYEAGGWRSVGPDGRDEPVYPDDQPMPDWAGKVRPSMFMPRAFSRITLEVTSVRVERLRDISEGDAMAEGCDPHEINPVGWYAELWNSLNAESGHGWQANPWVWVIQFQRLV